MQGSHLYHGALLDRPCGVPAQGHSQWSRIAAPLVSILLDSRRLLLLERLDLLELCFKWGELLARLSPSFEGRLVLGAEFFLSNVEVSSDTLDPLRAVLRGEGVSLCDATAKVSFVCFVLFAVALILVHINF